MKTVIGIKALKDEYLKAKLNSGDLRGLKNRFELASKYGIDEMKIMYLSAGGKGYNSEGKCELEITVAENEDDLNGYPVWNWKDLKTGVEKKSNCYIEIKCNLWNKYNTDVNERKPIAEFYYKTN